eukprot:jgi/Botrbrau1/7009/Bobra.0165s0038.1
MHSCAMLRWHGRSISRQWLPPPRILRSTAFSQPLRRINPRLHWGRYKSQRTATLTVPSGLYTQPWGGTADQFRALDEVKRQMEESSLGVPDSETVRWFLRDRDFDVEETVLKLQKFMKWRSEIRPQDLTLPDVAEEAATGKAYLHKHFDISGRPVVVVRARLHVTGQRPLEESQRYCAYLLEEALRMMQDDTETILGIFDLRGFGPSNADFGFVRFLVDVFFQYYPKRLGASAAGGGALGF